MKINWHSIQFNRIKSFSKVSRSLNPWIPSIFNCLAPDQTNNSDYIEKTIFPIPLILNGIWSWWQFSFRFWTKWNSIWFRNSKINLSPRSYPIQCERKWKYSLLSARDSQLGSSGRLTRLCLRIVVRTSATFYRQSNTFSLFKIYIHISNMHIYYTYIINVYIYIYMF